jgi:mannose-6-phosphate isomerase
VAFINMADVCTEHGLSRNTLMNEIPLYPLRFEPIYQYRPWGGRRLGKLLSAPLPRDEPIGEAWLLSDRDDHPSLVADGPLTGNTIGQLLKRSPEQLLGKLSGHFSRFPLLLKFLDVGKKLSVQVHPSDANKRFIPEGDTGKTEAWVVLETGPEARIYAGLKPATSAEGLRQAIANGSVPDRLASFKPKLGDAVLVLAGTVHSLSDVVVFEVQENSDVTFRLYDWDQIDSKTGHRRPLQVDQAMACIDFMQGVVDPVIPIVEESEPLLREKLIHCDHFDVTRISGQRSFFVGAAGMPRVLVCLAGNGQLEHAGTSYAFGKGDVLLLPAVTGACACRPHGAVSLLEISLPEVS